MSSKGWRFAAALSLGAILWLVLGIGGGVLAATRPRSAVDRITTGVSSWA